MKRRIVEISEDARCDLFALYDWIAEAGSPNTALAYVELIEEFCKGLDVASERGSLEYRGQSYCIIIKRPLYLFYATSYAR